MASLKERLRDKCICGHEGGDHVALDRGTHIALERCTAIVIDRDKHQPCTCPQFRRVEAGASGRSKRNRRAHGVYLKSGFRF